MRKSLRSRGSRREYILFVIIVPAAVNDIDSSIFDMVNKAVFFVDPSAELTLQVSLQGFRFFDSVHCAVAFDILDQEVDALEGLLILRLPIQVILPGVIRPDFFTHRRLQSAHAQCLCPHGAPEQISARMPD